MTIEELFYMTKFLEHLKSGGKKSCRDVNKIYSYLPEPKLHTLTKKHKIRLIQTFWNRIADQTMANYLINKQNPEKNGNIQEDKPEL